MDIDELNSQLEYLNETKLQLKQAITDKGQSISDADTFRSYVSKVSNISTLATETADADATADDIAAGKTAYINGKKVVGNAIIGKDVSDATVQSENLDLGIIAYSRDFIKVTGTTPVYDSSSEPIALPSSNVGLCGSSEIVKTGETSLLLIHNRYGETGNTMEFPIEKLPVDIAGKSILLRCCPKNYLSDTMTEYQFVVELYVANMETTFEVRNDSSHAYVWAYNDNDGERAYFQCYEKIVNMGSITDVTSGNWSEIGLKTSYGPRAIGIGGWYVYTTKETINSGGLTQGNKIAGRGNESILVKTTLGANALMHKLKTGAQVYTRLNNTDLSNAIGLKPGDLKEGVSVLGVDGTLDISDYSEYTDSLKLANAILTGSDVNIYKPLEYIYIHELDKPFDIGVPIFDGTNWTIEFSIQFKTLRNYSNVLCVAHMGGTAHETYIDSSGNYNVNLSASSWGTISGCFGAGTTYKVKHTYESGTFKTYINDTLRLTQTNTLVTTKDTLKMGLRGQSFLDAYIYGIKIYKSDKLIFDGVPVLHNDTNAVGLFDNANFVFVTASGEIPLQAGPVVEGV